MKHFLRFAVLGSAIALPTRAALAAPVTFVNPITGAISISGLDSMGPVSGGTAPYEILFTNPGIVLGSTGTLASQAPAGATVTLQNLTDLTASNLSAENGVILFSTPSASCTGVTPCVTFSITGLTTVAYTDTTTSPSSTFPELTVDGTGLFTEFGYTSTPGTFALSATNDGLMSFTLDATAGAAAPEPSSLVLLGSGLVGVGGVMLRRRRMAFEIRPDRT